MSLTENIFEYKNRCKKWPGKMARSRSFFSLVQFAWKLPSNNIKTMFDIIRFVVDLCFFFSCLLQQSEVLAFFVVISHLSAWIEAYTYSIQRVASVAYWWQVIRSWINFTSWNAEHIQWLWIAKKRMNTLLGDQVWWKKTEYIWTYCCMDFWWWKIRYILRTSWDSCLAADIDNLRFIHIFESRNW